MSFVVSPTLIIKVLFEEAPCLLVSLLSCVDRDKGQDCFLLLLAWLSMPFCTSFSSCVQYFFPVSYHFITHNLISELICFVFFVCMDYLGCYWQLVKISCDVFNTYFTRCISPLYRAVWLYGLLRLWWYKQLRSCDLLYMQVKLDALYIHL